MTWILIFVMFFIIGYQRGQIIELKKKVKQRRIDEFKNNAHAKGIATGLDKNQNFIFTFYGQSIN